MPRDPEQTPDFESEFLDVLLAAVGGPAWLNDGIFDTRLGLDLSVLFEKIYSAGVEDGRRQAREEDGLVRDHIFAEEQAKLF